MHTPATLLTVHAFGVIVSAATKGSIQILDRRESFAKIESATVKTRENSHVNRILMVFQCFECSPNTFLSAIFNACHTRRFSLSAMSHEHLASPVRRS
jgi:hypothetical protein